MKPRLRLIPEHPRLDAQGNQSTCDYPRVLKPMSIECPNQTYHPAQEGSRLGVMSFPQRISRLIIVFTILPFLISAASAATSAPSHGTNWKRLAASPSSVSFGNTQVGSSQTEYETVTNSGNSTVTISQAAVTGAGF